MKKLAFIVTLLIIAMSACSGGDSAGAGEKARRLRRSDSLPHIKNLYQKYTVASEDADYFAKHNLLSPLGRNFMALGDVMAQIGDSARAAAYYSQAEDCFRACGSDYGVYEIELHRTNVLDSVQKLEVYNKLLADPAVRADTGLLALSLKGAYLCTDSLPLLDSCINLIQGTPNSFVELNHAFLLSLRAEAALKHGEIGVALSLIPKIKAADNTIALRRQYLHSIMAWTYYQAGMKDSCIQELLQTIFWTDSAYRETNAPAIYSGETRRLIEMTEANARLEHRNIVLLWAISVLVLLIAGMWIYFRARRRQANARHEIELLDSRLESVSQSHNAQAAVIEENQRLVSDLRQALDRSATDGSDGASLARDVMRILNLYGIHDENRKAFLTVNREISARFTARLKADFPTLSEGQLRLAALIAAGVDSRQLTTILNISNKSLYTSRYRLRTQLGLSKSASLEEFLRSYASPDA